MAKRILVVGYGIAGKTLAEDLVRHGAEVTGFLDDASTEPKILGRLDQVNEVIDKHHIDLVYFAIPTAKAPTVREFIRSIQSTSVEIAIVPRTYDIISKDTVDISDLTDVDVLDLVGREPVRHELESSRAFLAGKRAMITGAAGSIGSRLSRQIARLGVEHVLCVDWWENGMFYLGHEMAKSNNVSLKIADIKSTEHMKQLFDESAPEIVFHAAAYKHVPLMQENPIEAINNNVWGSLNLMRLAIDHGVKAFVYVSTDKAVNPVNVMGATKRIGEMLMETLAANGAGTRFSAVRFGNVIESHGSVMEIFRSQIAKRQPLTVTDPEVTRFFMTIDEASQLIIQSAALGTASDIFVLDMGEPVKILDLATSLLRAARADLGIEITGLRPGEKLHEELTYEPDKVVKTANQKIFVLRGEKDFDKSAFLRSVEDLLERSRSYRLSADEAVAWLRNAGFAIQ